MISAFLAGVLDSADWSFNTLWLFEREIEKEAAQTAAREGKDMLKSKKYNQ
jgi:hypothetical protein